MVCYDPHITGLYNPLYTLKRPVFFSSFGTTFVDKIHLFRWSKATNLFGRAVYSQADLMLLDDPLSAVDSHVARKLMNMFQSSLLAKSSIVLWNFQQIWF